MYKVNDLSPGFKQKVVKEELDRLYKAGYISHETYVKIVNDHLKYYQEVLRKRQEAAQAQRAKQANKKYKRETVLTSENRPVQKQQARTFKTEPKPVQSSLSPQEARERNITWLLNLGVVLLLIGGLILATSTWELLADWMKAGLIGLVSLMFYSLAYITNRFLKIEKTAFAFLVLGSLFLPIVILSVGHFELFGPYFSIYGEGLFLYGAAGSLVLLPLYYTFATKLNSRLFIWFTYVTLSSFASFLIGSLKLQVDGFYLLIMLFNAGLVGGFFYLKKHKRLEQFTKEFVLYIQGNLILSTIFMLAFFNSEVMYSFNLLLTAIIYFSMIYVTNHKEYHFVFSALIVYSAYQLIEFSVLYEVNSIAYALIGFIFLAIPKFVTDDKALQKAFQYTSAFVAGIAFVFITLQGMLLKFNDPSILLFFAYIIISVNFIFLVNTVKQRLFAYISSVFIMTALFEVILLGRLWFGFESINLPTFFAAVLLYFGLGCFSNFKVLNRLKASTRDITAIVAIISMLISFILIHWIDLAIMLLTFSIVMIFMQKFEERKAFTDSEVAPLLHSVALALSVNFFYREWVGGEYLVPVGAESLVVASLIVLAANFAWKYVKQEKFHYHAFFVAQTFYLLGILSTFVFSTESVIRMFIMLGGIGMAYLLYRKTKWDITPYFVSGMFLLFYLTGLYAVHSYFDITSHLLLSLQYIGGAVILLGLGLYIGKWDQLLKNSSLQIAHLFLPVSLLVGFMFYGNISVWAFLVATIIYGISSLKVLREWLVKLFLYASFTFLWLFVSLFIDKYGLNTYYVYSFFITSIVIATIWFISKGDWPRRIVYYFIPFSLLGMLGFIDENPNTILLLITTLIYGLGILFVMHKEKWDQLSIIPLVISYLAIFIFNISGPYDINVGFGLYASFGAILVVAGHMIYSNIYKGRLGKLPHIDWYTVVGAGSLFSLYLYIGEAVWMSIVPGLIISALFISQRKRVPEVESSWILFAAIVYLIEPYYAMLGHISIPELIELELYVLPWVLFCILFKRFAVGVKEDAVHYAQWVVLGISAVLLLQGTIMSSNVYDALILGSLALLSILGGMRYQLKSFFFIGSGVLLLNVFFQTRPFWNELPLWVYILVAGSILIGVASYNEYHKQKVADGKETLASSLKEKMINNFKKWK